MKFYSSHTIAFLFSDLQMVNIGLRVLARPDQTMLPKIYQQLGRDYDERVLPSIINEVSFINYRHYLLLLLFNFVL